jgi:hypothetical protein
MWGKGRIVAAAVVVAAVGLTAVQVVGAVRSDRAEEARHRVVFQEHQVAYHLRSVGSADEYVRIAYSGPEGRDLQGAAPPLVPEWNESLTTEPGVWQLHMFAGAPATNLNFQLTCTVEVDGVEVGRDSGHDCEVWFQMEELPRVTASASPST